jgi:hypothetical protein
MNNKSIGVVITDGVGFRNFILSDFISEAKKEFNSIVIFSCLPASAYDSFQLNCKIIELDVFTEKFPTWFFRKSKEVAHLQLHKKGNFGIQDNLKTNRSKARNPRGLATKLIFGFTNFLHSEKWIQKFNTYQQLTFATNSITKAYEKLLIENKIDLLFFTHQRPPYIAPLIYAAEKLQLKTSAFIFSWDNLASKGRMAGNFDFYLVWSALMKSELLHFYQSIKEEHIHIVGTPQFEPYVLERYQSTKEEFAEKFKIDTSKQTVFFSCGDVSTSPNDPVYIETIAKGIVENKFTQKINLLVRTSPAEEPTRFKALADKYPFIIWNYPDWFQARSNHQESWSQRIPSVNDVKNLRALLEFTDISVNMLSTMSLDTMLFQKPVINTVFGNGYNGLKNDQRFFNYAHIKKVIDGNAVWIAKDENELIEALNVYLNTPTLKLQEQKDMLQMQIGKPLLGTSANIVRVLSKIN